MLTQRSEVANARSSLAKSSSDLANEGGRGAAGQQGELGEMVDDNINGGVGDIKKGNFKMTMKEEVDDVSA